MTWLYDNMSLYTGELQFQSYISHQFLVFEGYRNEDGTVNLDCEEGWHTNLTLVDTSHFQGSYEQNINAPDLSAEELSSMVFTYKPTCLTETNETLSLYKG